jgi:hypothetical protein
LPGINHAASLQAEEWFKARIGQDGVRSMKVTGSSGVGSAQGPRPARAGGGDGFRIVAPAAAAGPGQASSVSNVSGIVGVEALLALQDVGTPTERKRRAVGRAGRILDVLDEIKVAMLDGGLNGADLDRLRRAVREERAGTDDPKLEQVLEDIELRAAVEVAKLEVSSRAA